MSVSTANFGRYASQTEHSMDDLTVKKPIIPPLMSLSITPPPSSPVMTNNTQQSFIMPTSVTKENIEPLPFPQHVPGPIQRPNKLSCSSIFQTLPLFHDPTRSPDTPEVLVQINHLVDHQNSMIASSSSNVTNSSSMINDLPTPNVPWTPFTPSEWPTKYESSWPLPPPPPTQNPFAQRQISKDESNLWPEISTNTSWLKFSPTSPLNRQENETNIPFWNPSEIQSNSSTPWWPKTPSDENNNDQSRWEFAR
jgi:hypothetical protein